MNKKNSELIILWYKDLEKRFTNIITNIPYNDENKKIELPLLCNIIVEAGSLIDTIFRKEYRKRLTGIHKKDLTIHDFAPYYEKRYNLSKIKTLIYIYPPFYLSSFENWVNSSTKRYNNIFWWNNYNKLKHNRTEESSRSTLESAMNIICALHQIISQMQTFFYSLIRNEMISYSLYNLDFLRSELKRRKPDFTILIESKLFATPRGRNNFPKHISKISPYYLGNSIRLKHFLGKSH